MPLLSKLTVFFEDPFWVATVELQDGEAYQVARHVFGAEPTLPEIEEFACGPWERLRFTRNVEVEAPIERRLNPKRRLREARKEMAESAGRGTLSQQVLAQQREENAAQRQHVAAARKQDQKDAQFAQRSAKRKEKHRGH